MMATGLVAAAAAPAMAADPVVVSEIDFEDGTFAPWTGRGTSPTVVEDPDDASNKVLAITGAASWHGLEVPASLLEAGAEYELSFRVRLADPAGAATDVRLEGSSDPYPWLIGNQSITGAWSTVTETFRAPDPVMPATITAGLTSYFIDDVVLTRTADAPIPPPTVTVVSEIDFEDGTFAPWTGRGTSPTVVADPDDGANRVLAITGTDTWHGLEVPASLLEAGAEYELSFRARLVDPGTADLRFEGSSSPWPWLISNTPITEEWTIVTGAFTAPDPAMPATITAGATSYLIDDILLTRAGDPVQPGDLLPPGHVFVDEDFETGTPGEWSVRDTPNPTTGATQVQAVGTVASPGAAGSEYAFEVSNRDNQGDGPMWAAGAIPGGQTVKYTMDVRFADGQEPGNLSLSIADGDGGFFNNSITGVTNEWTTVSGTFNMPVHGGSPEIYLETAWASGTQGNTSTILIDNVRLEVPVPPAWDGSLEPLKDTVGFPMGVAIDSRETTGSASELLLHHFSRIVAENHMKPESWYVDPPAGSAPGTPGTFRMHPQAGELLRFAQANDLSMFGHVLFWHSQTPGGTNPATSWWFQGADGHVLSRENPADVEFMKQRMEEHVRNVAQAITDEVGLFGSDTNPIKAFEVANEFIADDAGMAPHGLRNSNWYGVMGDEFVPAALEIAERVINGKFRAPGAERVQLWINEYNTESSQSKRTRYLDYADYLINERGLALDGAAHQFHVSMSLPVNNLRVALEDFTSRNLQTIHGVPLKQAVTELDVTLRSDAFTRADLVEQGHYYRDAFAIFRDHHATAGNLEFVTVWGLTDNRSWRGDRAPLLFDGDLQAKPAYHGAANGELAGLERSANAFGGDLTLDAASFESVVWKQLPTQQLMNGAGSFGLRWTADHLTLFGDVVGDNAELVYQGTTYTVAADGTTGGAFQAVTKATATGFRFIAHIPHTAALNSTAPINVVALSGGAAVGGWVSPGNTGDILFLEDLSYTEVIETAVTPVIDGQVDDVWTAGNTIRTGKLQQGTPDADTAKADVRTLWNENTLFVLAEIDDPTVNASHANPWERDSVEIFVDLGNAKNGGYRNDHDAQIRIDANGEVTVGQGNQAAQLERTAAAVATVDGGWVLEVAIELKADTGHMQGQWEYFGGEGSFLGFDIQVNDNNAPAGDNTTARQAVNVWANPTTEGYQDTTRWGVAQLVAAPEQPGPDPTPERTSVDVARGDIPLVASSFADARWGMLTEVLTNDAASFLPLWADDHLALMLAVADDANDTIEIDYGGTVVTVTRAGVVDGADAIVSDDGTGWRAIVHIAHAGVAHGTTVDLDVRVGVQTPVTPLFATFAASVDPFAAAFDGSGRVPVSAIQAAPLAARSSLAAIAGEWSGTLTFLGALGPDPDPNPTPDPTPTPTPAPTPGPGGGGGDNGGGGAGGGAGAGPGAGGKPGVAAQQGNLPVTGAEALVAIGLALLLVTGGVAIRWSQRSTKLG